MFGLSSNHSSKFLRLERRGFIELDPTYASYFLSTFVSMAGFAYPPPSFESSFCLRNSWARLPTNPKILPFPCSSLNLPISILFFLVFLLHYVYDGRKSQWPILYIATLLMWEFNVPIIISSAVKNLANVDQNIVLADVGKKNINDRHRSKKPYRCWPNKS